MATEYDLAVGFDDAPFETARWLSADAPAELERFPTRQRASLAEDHDGAPVFLARNAWDLSAPRRTGRRCASAPPASTAERAGPGRASLEGVIDEIPRRVLVRRSRSCSSIGLRCGCYCAREHLQPREAGRAACLQPRIFEIQR